MRILVTGFGPFLSVADNPSARIAEKLAAEPPYAEMVVRVLPVSFRRVERIVVDLLEEAPYVALLLGVAARDRGIRLERFARNRSHGRSADVDGFVPGDAAICEGASDAYEAQVDLAALLARLRADGVPARISEDAGGYVCNHAYFTAQHAIHEQSLATRCLFVHVPGDASALPPDRQLAAVRSILDFLVAA